MTLINSKNIIWLLKIIVFALLILLLQLMLIPKLNFWGAVPSLPLTLIILVTLLFNVEAAIPLAVSMAVVFYQFLYKPTFLFNWLIAPIFAKYVNPPLSLGRESIWIIQVGLCSFLLELINIFVLSMSSGMEMFTNNLPNLFLVPLMNSLLAIPILFILKKLFNISDYSHY